MIKRKSVFYIGFFAVLVVGFIAALSWAIPGFTEQKVPVIGTVQPFSFTDQDSVRFTQAGMQGKVTAVEYFFTTCTGICPRMNKAMKNIYTRYQDQPDFLILSHTSDPANDNPARLKRYADSLGVNTARWKFLTGPKDSLYFMARHAYRIDDPGNNVADINDDFLHTQFVALVNRKGEVVKIVDALKPSEMKELEDEVGKLLAQR